MVTICPSAPVLCPIGTVVTGVTLFYITWVQKCEPGFAVSCPEVKYLQANIYRIRDNITTITQPYVHSSDAHCTVPGGSLIADQ